MERTENCATQNSSLENDHEDERRSARIDLAAAHRIAVMNDFHEGIDNHFTLVVPGSPDSFYVNAFGHHWSEVTASSLLEVSYNGRIVSGEGIADISAVSIHAPLHRDRPDAKCVLHTHMPYTTAITQLADMTIEMTGQAALMFYGKIAYDYEYNGLAEGPEEGERMAAIMGNKPILMLGNHGVVVTGRSVAHAFHRLYFVERVARTQLYSMWTGQPRKQVPHEILEKVRIQFSKPGANLQKSEAEYHFTALKRLLDKQGTNYRD